MKSFFYFILLCSYCGVMNGQELSFLEYFIDTDPGIGNATQISLQDEDTTGLEITASLVGISPGLHSLHLRTVDDSNSVSLVNTIDFVKASAPSQEVRYLEYFIDVDPGFGLANQISINKADTSGLGFPVDISSLSKGLHNLILRSRDEDGGFSLSNQHSFVKIDGLADSLVYAEHFYDNDPGFGEATEFSISGTETTKTLNLNTSALGSGLHGLNIRLRSAKGYWSLTKHIAFIKIRNDANQLVKGEYFIDTDPGFGNATSFLLGSEDSSEHLIPIDIDALETGLHHLFFRTLDDNGSWSLSSAESFLKISTEGNNLVRGEYFIDTDPGFGNGTSFLLGSEDSSGHLIPVDLTSLSIGLHYLLIRTQDERGSWSISNRKAFLNVSRGSENLVETEYFIDDDPGFGNATSLPLPLTDDTTFVMSVNVRDLELGVHTLFIRTRDSSGFWSISNTVDFIKIQMNTQLAMLEYFIDDDPGFGLGTQVSLAGTDSSGIMIALNTGSLGNGLHSFSMRCRANDGEWSLTNTKHFIKHTDELMNLVKFEYFFSDEPDPGFGQGTALSLPTAPDIMGEMANITVPDLDFGYHQLMLRAYSDRGDWSMTQVIDFAIYCQDTLLLMDVMIPSDTTYQVANLIQSNGTIQPMYTEFLATEIELLPGFEVPIGISFLANSISCLSESNDPNDLDDSDEQRSRNESAVKKE